MAFTHLHVHTEYSLLDGAARITDLVSRAKELGMTALAVTDHGSMYGVIDFYKECRKQGIKPIIGMEAYVAPKSIYDRTTVREYAHLILLCKNDIGYKNLMKLSSMAFIDGFYYKPRIDYDILQENSEGLICLSACLAGDIPRLLLNDRYDEAEAIALRLKNVFKDDFYIEIQNHGIPEQMTVLPRLYSLAEKLGIKSVATNDVHYVLREDAEAQDALLCIQTAKFVNDTDRMRMYSEEFYLKSEDEMRIRLSGYETSIDVTQEIADKCNINIVFGERHLPGFIAPDNMDNETYLRQLCREGMRKKLGDSPSREALDRLDYELDIIVRMGFVDYFLIVWDFINFAKSNGIMVGPGRGSGAASLAAYCLDITDVDPLKYSLLFERFLNPERISMPDFDIDFCFERRQEVIDYVVAKYGEDHVAQIITFGTMAARAVVRDVGRVLGMPYADVDRIAKLIPQVIKITLKQALEMVPELKTLYDQDDAVKKLLDLSMKLEGLPRHASTHAAGVVISSAPTTEFVPLQRNEDSITTQFPMGTLEELGLLKMDFLGLRTLTVIRDCCSYIEQGGGNAPDFSSMGVEDPNVYKLICSGDTIGIFQLESAGMTQFMMQMKPDCFEDIIAGIALYRPGPMEQIPRYLAGKQDANSVRYVDERLRPILNTTYGCMVYQEQVMQIVRDLAGYSYGRSDLIRRAMSKKKHDVMEHERKNFINGIVDENGVVSVPGAVRNGVSREAANSIFDEMMDFASYAFNKAHAACYAVVAYRTGYLKYYYPVELMTALINSFLGNSDKISEYIYYCRKRGFKILSPDINRSGVRFSVEDGCIRFGLAAIRNVGEEAMHSIIRNRNEAGEFKDFFDFINRAEAVNKRMVEGLIKAGCFDKLGISRLWLLEHYEHELEVAISERKRRETGQLSLFDIVESSEVTIVRPTTPEQKKEYHMNELLAIEKEVMGIYISGHPLMEFEPELAAMSNNCKELSEADGSGALKDNCRITVGGILGGIRTRPTKSGNGMMAYGVIEDMSGQVEFAAFPTVYTKFKQLFAEGKPAKISGRLSMHEDRANTVMIDEVSELKKGDIYRLYLRFNEETVPKWDRIIGVLRRYPGKHEVFLHDAVSGKTLRAPKDAYVNGCDRLLEVLENLLGRSNVIFKKIN